MGAFRNTCKTRPEAQRAPPSDQQWSRCRIRSFRSKNDWRLVHLRIAPLLAEASSANPHLHSPPECAPLQTSGIGHQSTLVPSLASRRGSACREGDEQNALACAEELLVEARCTRTALAWSRLSASIVSPISPMSRARNAQRAAASARIKIDAHLRTIWVECV